MSGGRIVDIKVANARSADRSAEAAEAQLDSFISRRHEQRAKDEGERRAEEMWAESVRRHEAQMREENRLLWLGYHKAAAERARRNLEALVARHEAAATMLEAELGQESA